VQSKNSVGAFLVCLLAAAEASVGAQTATVVGRVVDARTRQPLAQVLVHVVDQPVFAETGPDGRFQLARHRADTRSLRR
jgi:hypothetical protein